MHISSKPQNRYQTPIEDMISSFTENEKLRKTGNNVVSNDMKKSQDKARALRDLLVSNCTDDELDKHFENFSKPEVLELINSIGDIEKPVPLGMALLKKVPAFRKLALKAGVKLLFT